MSYRTKQNKKNKTKNFDYQLTKGKKTPKRQSEYMVAVVKNPGEVRARTVVLHRTAPMRVCQPLYQLSQIFILVGLRLYSFVFTVVKSTMPWYQKLQCRPSHPTSSTCTLWFVSDIQRKNINTDDHLSMYNCPGATELDKAVKPRIRQSAWCNFSRVDQIRGYVPRENEHHGAHLRTWCTNSRAGARLGGGERICCYTSVETEANFPLANSLKALRDCMQFFFMLNTR